MFPFYFSSEEEDFKRQTWFLHGLEKEPTSTGLSQQGWSCPTDRWGIGGWIPVSCLSLLCMKRKMRHYAAFQSKLSSL